MSTQVLAIGCVLGLALLALFGAWFAVAAARLSGAISESERLAALGPASANWDYPADGSDGSVNSDRSECDHG